MMSAPMIQIPVGCLMAAVVMTGLWLVQRKTHNAGIVDTGWAAGTGLLGAFYAATSNEYLPRRILNAMLIGTWSARLTFYLDADRVRGRPEDGRYASLRNDWCAQAEHNLFFFFQSQAFFIVFFALPILVVAWHPRAHWSGWDLTGVLIWCVSVGNTMS